MTQRPALSLAAIAGRRKATLQFAQRIKREGFGGIYCPSFGDRLQDVSFFIGNIVPTCSSDDKAAATAVLRRILRGDIAPIPWLFGL